MSAAWLHQHLDSRDQECNPRKQREPLAGTSPLENSGPLRSHSAIVEHSYICLILVPTPLGSAAPPKDDRSHQPAADFVPTTGMLSAAPSAQGHFPFGGTTAPDSSALPVCLVSEQPAESLHMHPSNPPSTCHGKLPIILTKPGKIKMQSTEKYMERFSLLDATSQGPPEAEGSRVSSSGPLLRHPQGRPA